MLTTGATSTLSLLWQKAEFQPLGIVTNLFLAFGRERLKTRTEMIRKANIALRRPPERTGSPLLSDKVQSKFYHQIAYARTQRAGNFHKRINRGRLFPAFNAADKDGRKVGFFSQLFLREIRIFASGTDGITQEAAVLLTGRHARLRNEKQHEVTMSLTPIFGLPPNRKLLA